MPQQGNDGERELEESLASRQEARRAVLQALRQHRARSSAFRQQVVMVHLGSRRVIEHVA